MTEQGGSCSICGALVVDTAKHKSFHGNLLRLIFAHMGEEFQQLQVETVERNIRFLPVGGSDD